MKTLTRIFFCTFALVIFNSCEPEEIPSEGHPHGDVIADTGDQEGEVVYKDETGD